MMKKARNRKISIIMAIALTIACLAEYVYFSKILLTASLTLFVIAILIIIPKIQERRKMKNEKSNIKAP